MNTTASFRSKERVRDLGEVWTPDWVVEKMCGLIPEETWKDPAALFLEPTCGNGAIIEGILRKRLQYVNYMTAVNTLWAMDIMEDNIFSSKERIYNIIKEHLDAKKIKLEKQGFVNLVATVNNNIFVVKDALTYMPLLNDKPYFSTDPSGKKQVLSAFDKKDALEEARLQCRSNPKAQPFHMFFS